MSDETSILKKIWLALSPVTTLFRINTGMAWVGKGKPQRLNDGSVKLNYARPISLGLSFPNTKSVNGVSDLIGYTTIMITPEMIGKKVAVITTIETKNSKGGTKRDEQIKWNTIINNAGGISGFANSEETAKEIIKKYMEKLNG